jgi:transcriptional regulator with XRE-family HTH domain
MMDLSFSKPSEIVKLLCERLRKERLSRQMTQADVAARAGIGVNTVSNLEAGRNVGFETVVRVAMVKGVEIFKEGEAR